MPDNVVMLLYDSSHPLPSIEAAIQLVQRQPVCIALYGPQVPHKKTVLKEVSMWQKQGYYVKMSGHWGKSTVWGQVHLGLDPK